MKLPRETRNVIVSSSLKYLGRHYDRFHCLDFVIKVYEKAGVIVPSIERYGSPPMLFNITREELNIWEYGYPIFLRRYKYEGAKRFWTHIGITLPGGNIVHTSSHLGGNKVSIHSKEEVFEIYQYTPSYET